MSFISDLPDSCKRCFCNLKLEEDWELAFHVLQKDGNLFVSLVGLNRCRERKRYRDPIFEMCVYVCVHASMWLKHDKDVTVQDECSQVLFATDNFKALIARSVECRSLINIYRFRLLSLCPFVLHKCTVENTMGVIWYDCGEMAEEGSRLFSLLLCDGCLCEMRVKCLLLLKSKTMPTRPKTHSQISLEKLSLWVIYL